MSENKDLGIYEGCYVELRNGDIEGPIGIKPEPNDDIVFSRRNEDLNWWRDCGRSNRNREHAYDIIRVLPKATTLHEKIADDFAAIERKATIPPHVTKAAMDAGIKAEPAYEQFVNAVLEAGLAAMGDRVVPVGLQDVEMDALCEEISTGLYGNKGFLERPEAAQQHIRNVADRVISYMADKRIPQNESENRIRDSEKTKGGLSDPTSPPLEGVTICFTGALNMPRDTHKGIAESLGANVAGSVHKHTTLVVFGPGAGSKLDKAVEHNIPRMSESAWMWLAARFGYGKATHVSPYGKFSDDLVVSLRLLAGNVGSVLFSHRQKLNAAADELERLREHASTPSVQTIIEAIGAAVREWRETHPDMGMVPPISMIAKKVHSVISNG